MPILVPAFCCLVVFKGIAKYYNSSKACDYSRKLYKKSKDQMEENLRYKRKRNKKMSQLLEELDGYVES